jgi:hypothetical protein
LGQAGAAHRRASRTSITADNSRHVTTLTPLRCRRRPPSHHVTTRTRLRRCRRPPSRHVMTFATADDLPAATSRPSPPPTTSQLPRHDAYASFPPPTTHQPPRHDAYASLQLPTTHQPPRHDPPGQNGLPLPSSRDGGAKINGWGARRSEGMGKGGEEGNEEAGGNVGKGGAVRALCRFFFVPQANGAA